MKTFPAHLCDVRLAESHMSLAELDFTTKPHEALRLMLEAREMLAGGPGAGKKVGLAWAMAKARWNKLSEALLEGVLLAMRELPAKGETPALGEPFVEGIVRDVARQRIGLGLPMKVEITPHRNAFAAAHALANERVVIRRKRG